MTEIFQELVKETISKIERLESRSRSRSTKAQLRFNHAVETTLIDLWKATHCIPIRECAVISIGHSTAHSLRHTMRDHLRAVGYPIDMIDEIGGGRSVGAVGASYGDGYRLEQKRMWLIRVSLSDDLA